MTSFYEERQKRPLSSPSPTNRGVCMYVNAHAHVPENAPNGWDCRAVLGTARTMELLRHTSFGYQNHILGPWAEVGCIIRFPQLPCPRPGVWSMSRAPLTCLGISSVRSIRKFSFTQFSLRPSRGEGSIITQFFALFTPEQVNGLWAEYGSRVHH